MLKTCTETNCCTQQRETVEIIYPTNSLLYPKWFYSTRKSTTGTEAGMQATCAGMACRDAE